MAATVSIVEKEVAFQNHLQSFSIVNHGFIKLEEFFAAALEFFVHRLEEIIEAQTIVVVGACFVGEYAKSVMDENGQMHVEKQKLFTHTPSIVIDFETILHEHFNESIVRVLNSKIEERELRGSGFKLLEIVELNVQVSSFAPLAGSSYIDLPAFLSNKKAIVNVQNEDDEYCFEYAVLSALYPPEKNGHRPQKYDEYRGILNFTGIQFPVRTRDITKFEKQNPTISINVYMFDDSDNKVYPVRLTKDNKEKHIHLMLLSEQCENPTDTDGGNITVKTHYCWIKNFGALLGRQTSSNTRRKIFCDRCLNYFFAQQAHDEHYVNCRRQNDCAIEMPTEDNNQIRFEKNQNKLMVPFIIYADIESLLKEPSENFCDGDKTRAFQQHEAFSIGYYFKHLYDDTKSYYKSSRGIDCIDWFVSELRSIAEKVYDILEHPKPMFNSPGEQQFKSEKQCHICGVPYTGVEVPVRDHSHITGEYRGSAHSECNRHYQESRYVPVVFHNLSHYDSHFIVKKLAVNEEGNMSAIALNDELYISFTKTFPAEKGKFINFIKFRFIDSFRFMPSSLDYLASLISSEKKKITHMQMGKYSENQIKLLEKKGIFCYDYMDSWSRLDDDRLPSKDLFYSKLTESHISDEDYKHALLVWDSFGIKSLGEYSDLYMQTDILLLADVFENFRETCYKIYGLDPAHYITAPSLTFDAMLKYTKVEIELLTDVDMLLFVERGIRGGISQCSKRYAKANNKRLEAGHKPGSDPNYLIYLDANNLYGHAMSQYLPLKGFKWCEKEFSAETISKIADNSDIGYIFEVDLEYPKDLHKLHSDYPLCPEKRPVSESSKQSKLLLTLYDKERYVVHYKMLKLILQQGLKLKKIHKVLQFDQSPWLKPYIDLNTGLRMRATSDFDKNFFKLMVNAIFGKTMENVRGRVDIKLKTKWEGRYGARKLIVQPNYKRWTAFDPNFVAIHMNHTKILMNKPISIGMAVLDISKEMMYDFFYNYLKRKYNERVELMYTDTDSFILNVKTECFYTDMMDDIDERYDTSDYAEDNIYGIPRKNKKKPGFFKDELNGKVMSEFVGLRSKMYAFTIDGSGGETKKAKGVKKYVLKNNIQFSDYLNSILRKTVLVRVQNTFRSKRHCMFSIRQEKIALSPYDDKRYVLEDNKTTLPWGHGDIPMTLPSSAM